jgi:hypothetical protein
MGCLGVLDPFLEQRPLLFHFHETKFIKIFHNLSHHPFSIKVSSRLHQAAALAIATGILDVDTRNGARNSVKPLPQPWLLLQRRTCGSLLRNQEPPILVQIHNRALCFRLGLVIVVLRPV